MRDPRQGPRRADVAVLALVTLPFGIYLVALQLLAPPTAAQWAAADPILILLPPTLTLWLPTVVSIVLRRAAVGARRKAASARSILGDGLVGVDESSTSNGFKRSIPGDGLVGVDESSTSNGFKRSIPGDQSTGVDESSAQPSRRTGLVLDRTEVGPLRAAANLHLLGAAVVESGIEADDPTGWPRRIHAVAVLCATLVATPVALLRTALQVNRGVARCSAELVGPAEQPGTVASTIEPRQLEIGRPSLANGERIRSARAVVCTG
jgi:hypothetical protein